MFQTVRKRTVSPSSVRSDLLLRATVCFVSESGAYGNASCDPEDRTQRVFFFSSSQRSFLWTTSVPSSIPANSPALAATPSIGDEIVFDLNENFIPQRGQHLPRAKWWGYAAEWYECCRRFQAKSGNVVSVRRRIGRLNASARIVYEGTDFFKAAQKIDSRHVGEFYVKILEPDGKVAKTSAAEFLNRYYEGFAPYSIPDGDLILVGDIK